MKSYPLIRNTAYYLRLAYGYLTSTIRNKLIAIISLMVLASVTILIYISLVIFEENMTNMIVFLHSKATNILANEVESKVENYKKGTIYLARYGTKYDLKARSEYSDFLYSASLKIGSHNTVRVRKKLINDRLLKALKIDRSELQKKIKNLQGRVSPKEFQVQNIAPLSNKAFWFISIPRKNLIFISIIYINKLYETFSGKSRGGDDSMYTSCLVDFNGNLLLHPKKDMLLKPVNMLTHPVVHRMFSGKFNNGVLKFDDGQEVYFGSFERRDRMGMGVISSIPESLALEGVNAVKWGSVLISVIIVSTAILFIYFFSNTISRPLRVLANAAGRVNRGEYDHSLKVKTRDEVGKLTRAFNTMTNGLKEREKLKGALNKFVNEEISNQVLRGEIKLGGERKEATVLFMDIRDFTALSEKLEPEQVVEFLNKYMTLMVDVISKTGGVVDKFIGDAIMAVWGAPVPKGNDVENCINAALLMRQKMIAFNKKRKQNKKAAIAFGCGVNTGPVISGQIGSPDRHEYTVIGDTVNLASRIEALSKPFAVDILIAENTYQLVKDQFSVVPMSKVKLKGKSKPQRVYALLGRQDDPKAPATIEELRKRIGRTYEPSSEKPRPAKKGEEKKYEIV